MDHDPVRYLSHHNTVDLVWRPLAEQRPRNFTRSLASFIHAASKPKRRALLVGVYDYTRFPKEIVKRMPPDQTPNFFRAGAVDPVYESQEPFSL
jgi:hypothetical protein